MSKNIFSYAEFYGFLQALPDLGIVPEATARNLKESSLRLFNVTSPLPETDIRDLDVNEVVGDYKMFSSVDVSRATIQSYKSRLLSAIQKFVEFQQLKYGVVMESIPQEESVKPKRRKRVDGKHENALEAIKTFALPIPIRDGLILRIENMPMDLSFDEAERIATIIKSFAIK
ncbi:hypothetical protein JT31_01745 [Cedecea neteri]|uniref:Core-binding (CB) domain-containing protein n=1 Tax=Cedecea neteri TaxID=158822 RepID=A0A089PWW1_9ENTR|nr:hypothetical protein [Cedecea neteri]AIR03391.1 hypothetical protein JT31_01745 [Cedecea neteri]